MENGVPFPSDELLQRYAARGESLKHSIPCLEWDFHVPWIDAILRLKGERNAVIMAHNYQAPEIFHTVADFTGDSLALAQEASRVTADVVVLCGVHFMAETTKVLAPERTVLIPDMAAGCSLASSITGEDVRRLRKQYPGVPVVTYVNTSAEVKAESDACCTSANALQVVEAMGSDRVLFLPDRLLGANVAKQTSVELILWDGACEVHERFTATQVRNARAQFGAKVVAHPECSPEVAREADFVGSTSAMAAWLTREKPSRVALITECSMADNLKTDFPQIEFVKPCNLCPHMQRITLPGIYRALRDMAPEVIVPRDVIHGAKRALDAMLAIGRGEKV
ncbi:quinolinate synthase [Luteibacter rhizovicinus DSM 16549]|uniref:Quinolinate synthase n=1 Tax=Luteibacter rhizovicinus DSM 16549 TaxID=1440763 RepID=A0A0G9HBA7_9GAMM|nr:quinolinate synthase NadA [Luteibacter rhizovicinus]APG05958.1 quinolinate synthase [Luteibacter rhizovicinus DSM 16549]KLD67095.1 quinolinate synthetase [Luteibacter rhizovicinus DSM 16549]KLD77631.1 quinolinate synthetase [Xanthomonas hyacinthi DSM 19077]